MRQVIGQHMLKNLQRRSICLDIHAYTAKRENDIEVQRANKGASARRARYHSSLMDTHNLREGQDFDKLPDTCVIFITEHATKGIFVSFARYSCKYLLRIFTEFPNLGLKRPRNGWTSSCSGPTKCNKLANKHHLPRSPIIHGCAIFCARFAMKINPVYYRAFTSNHGSYLYGLL